MTLSPSFVRKFTPAAWVMGLTALVIAPQVSAQFQKIIPHDPAKCAAGASVKITINGIESSTGKLRVQSYNGTKEDWLKKGRWLNRIELPAHQGTMTVCMPLPKAGVYGIAVRHDKNGNGKTDLREDGGGMSNNPSITIFNLGKPSYTKTQFTVGNSPSAITINMKYW